VYIALREYGLIMKDVLEGEYIYWPSDWWHEVHNMTPEVKRLSNGIFNLFFLPE
jgi:hypothetical protein